MLVHDLIKKSFLNNPNKTAIIENNEKYTYNDLWYNSLKIAHWINYNSENSSKIGLILENSVQAVFIIFGISNARTFY